MGEALTVGVRLDRLERENRRLRTMVTAALGAAVCALGVATIALAAHPSAALAQTPAVIRAERFVLVDRYDVERGALEVLSLNGVLTPSLSLKGDSRVSIGLYAWPQGPNLTIHGPAAGVPQLGVSAPNASLQLAITNWGEPFLRAQDGDAAILWQLPR